MYCNVFINIVPDDMSKYVRIRHGLFLMNVFALTYVWFNFYSIHVYVCVYCLTAFLTASTVPFWTNLSGQLSTQGLNESFIKLGDLESKSSKARLGNLKKMIHETKSLFVCWGVFSFFFEFVYWSKKGPPKNPSKKNHHKKNPMDSCFLSMLA